MRTLCCGVVGIEYHPHPPAHFPGERLGARKRLLTCFAGGIHGRRSGMLTVSQAIDLILAEARSFGTEKVPLEKGFARVLAADVRADRDYPPFDRSLMDGYALRTADFEPGHKYKVIGTQFAGDLPTSAPSKRGVALKIMTGAAVPKGFDAVIRREDAYVHNEGVTFTESTANPWQNIARRGEDMKRGAEIQLRGNKIDASTASLLASLGIFRPAVQKLPRVFLITTGDEVVAPEKKPGATQIRNANLFALRSLLSQYGIQKIRHRHVRDSPKQLMAALRAALAADLVLVTGGVSAGDSDYVPEILHQLGARQLFHKTAMKPGKPLWFGRRGKTVIFAMPGNPWSCQVVFRVYVVPFLQRCMQARTNPDFFLPLKSPRRKRDTLQHYFPVRCIAGAGNSLQLEPMTVNSSGDIRAGVGSDGLAVHPAGATELSAGDTVEYLPW